jgi:16S rRNA (guanine1516-N2)-methyltransferase
LRNKSGHESMNLNPANKVIEFFAEPGQTGLLASTGEHLERIATVVTERPGELYLTVVGGALSLANGEAVKQVPVSVDFTSGAARHRQQYGGGRSQAIARAVGLHQRRSLSVLDATAGLGRDAFVLASLGATVYLLERHPVVRLLLSDGLARARTSGDPVFDRMMLLDGSMDQLSLDTAPDVVYLDPMFPERRSKAAVKKDMAMFHQLVGADLDADTLLAPALNLAQRRVVVKRPRVAPVLAAREPNLALTGKSSRFDIYTLKSMTAD